MSEYTYSLDENNRQCDRICACGSNLTKAERCCCGSAPHVDHPEHYTVGGIECIDYIKAKLTPDQFYGYCIGNTIKYISRAGKKDGEAAIKDLNKADVYLKWARGM